MRVLVTGSRNWQDAGLICSELTELLRAYGRLTVVHGACPTGADAIADRWATNVPDAEPERHRADWNQHGKSAGPLRNLEMVSLGADECLAFIRDNSRGATHCATAAIQAGIRTRVFHDPRPPEYLYDYAPGRLT